LGKVEHLRLHELVLYVSTDLGDAMVIDLASIARPYDEG
jgi:hypothetical protein